MIVNSFYSIFFAWHFSRQRFLCSKSVTNEKRMKEKIFNKQSKTISMHIQTLWLFVCSLHKNSSTTVWVVTLLRVFSFDVILFNYIFSIQFRFVSFRLIHLQHSSGWRHSHHYEIIIAQKKKKKKKKVTAFLCVLVNFSHHGYLSHWNSNAEAQIASV